MAAANNSWDMKTEVLPEGGIRLSVVLPAEKPLEGLAREQALHDAAAELIPDYIEACHVDNLLNALYPLALPSEGTIAREMLEVLEQHDVTLYTGHTKEQRDALLIELAQEVIAVLGGKERPKAPPRVRKAPARKAVAKR